MQTDMISTQEQSEVKRQSARQMHKYVLIFVGIWILFVATFPIAYLRVSRSAKYEGGPFKSLDWDNPQRPADSY